MFSGAGLFKAITCPEKETCVLPNCIFSHQPSQLIFEKQNYLRESAGQLHGHHKLDDEPLLHEEGHRKRRKLDVGCTVAGPSPSIPRTTQSSDHGVKAYLGTLTSPESKNNASQYPDKTRPSGKQGAIETTAIADVPEIGRTTAAKFSAAIERKQVFSDTIVSRERARNGFKATLNPRLIPKDPAGHARRLLYLRKLHNEMVRLNDEVRQSSIAKTKSEHLTDDELVVSALDEEETLARENPSIYANVMGLRIVAYKKMKLKDWIEARKRLRRSKDDKAPSVKTPEGVSTGLSSTEEVAILSQMIPEKATLEKYGYLTVEPTSDQIEDARKATEISANWELCDRCHTRFQVFPGRREDGSLTSGGTCTYHWGRSTRPDKKRTDAITGEKSSFFSCCHEALGTAGCTTAPTHVFKVTNGTRLASILPFVVTPDNHKVLKEMAICFDCEMGYTVYGLELIRLSAVRWPQGTPLLDFLVRPKGAVLDLNTRFSGVSPQEFTNAATLCPGDSLHPQSSIDAESSKCEKMSPLQIVSSPEEARNLLFSQINTSTPLLGHALENDLNAMRIIHPVIVDTAILFPHPRGLPFRFGLQRLTKTYLQRDIQTAGASGHDSLEDAQATSDLVRWKVGRQWVSMQKDGWEIEDGCLIEPPKH